MNQRLWSRDFHMRQSGLSRREFLIQGSAALGMLAEGSVLGAQAAMPGSARKVLHIIGQSHIDEAWLWPWRDGCSAVLTTLRSALDRIQETPGFCFSFSSANYYRWVERADPGMFAEIQARIREGRWEAIGGWPVEPDCNIPSTESFVRHALLGKEYFKQSVGVDVKVGYNIDSFGHAAGLPTILRRAGYDYYVFSRPSEQEMHLPVMFWWEGPDGSRILALRIAGSYNGDTDAIRSRANEAFASGFDDAAFLFGVGDHGGATTKEQIRKILEMRTEPGLPELQWSTLENFFTIAERSPAFKSLPVIKGELDTPLTRLLLRIRTRQDFKSAGRTMAGGVRDYIDGCQSARTPPVSIRGLFRSLVEDALRPVSRSFGGHCGLYGLPGSARQRRRSLRHSADLPGRSPRGARPKRQPGYCQ